MISGSVCVSVCVCLSASILLQPHVKTSTNFQRTLPQAIALYSSGSPAICYVLPVLWVTSYFPIVVPAGHVDTVAATPLQRQAILLGRKELIARGPGVGAKIYDSQLPCLRSIYLLLYYTTNLNVFGLFATYRNVAVVDRRLRPRCRHLGSYFKHISFSCRYICRDIVINILHAHCGLVGPDCKKVLPSVCCLQRVFLRATPQAACEPRCLSLAATSSSLSLYANMTSSTKPEMRNVSLGRQSRTEPRQ